MSLTRRRFLGRAAVGGAVVAGGVTLPGCGNDVIAAPIVESSVEDDPTDPLTYGTVRLSLAQVPDLIPVGGAVTVRLTAPTSPAALRTWTLPDPPHLLVVHRGQPGAADEYIAVASACPHAGCPLGYSAALDRIECPCHSSQFRAVPDPANPLSCIGEVMHAPARQGPTPYQAAVDVEAPTTVVIDLRVIDECGIARLPPATDGKVVIPLAQFPMLAAAGGSLIGRPRGSTGGPIAIVRSSDAADASAFSAVSAVCTHLGCTIAYAADGAATACGTVRGNGFWCSCHCSEFAIDGSVRVGPATQPLARYGVAFDGTTLTITLA
jgi:Rieske Fe-S protein